MSLSGFLPVVSRRAVVIGGLALVSAVSVPGLRAQTTPPAAPQTPAPAQQDPLTFTSATPRVVFIGLTPDAAAAMEDALKQAKDVLSKSEKPEQKTQAAHWKIFKGPAQPDGSIPVIFVLDQTVPNASYNPFVILQNAGMSADDVAKNVTPLFTRVNAGLKNFAPQECTFMDMGGAAAGGSN